MLLSVKSKKVQNKNNKSSSSATSTTNKSIRRITTKTSSEWKLVCKGSPRLRHLSWLMSEQQRGKTKASAATLTSSVLTRKSVNKRESEGSEMARNWLNTLITTTTRSVTLSPQRIFNVQNVILLLLVFTSGLVSANGLQCYMCGQYNEGVGSITPCLNYSAKYQHLYLKECSKRSEKYCVTSGTIQTHLQEVTLKIYSDDECCRRHNNVTTSHQICGGVDEGYKGQCSGDSGGPLIYDNHIQLGIVSWSIKPCTTPPYPGVYTKVSHYIDWINKHIDNHND